MSGHDTVTLFINETATSDAGGDLEKNVGNLEGVESVEVAPPEQHGMGRGPSLTKMVTITYDPDATTPDALRARLEEMGYAVTVVSDQGI